MTNIFWTAYSKEERHSTIDAVKRIVSIYGDIIDFKFFSDISLTMAIEIEESKIDNLYDELTKMLRMDKFDNLNSAFKNERNVYLNITFTQGSGKLIVECPLA